MIDKELVADDNWCPMCGEPRGIGHCFTCKPSAPAPERPRSEVEEAREWLNQQDDRFSCIREASKVCSIPMLLSAYASHIRNQERERAAKIAESMYDKTYWDDPSAGIAAAIREN